jgi:adenylosuccinate synthase
MASSAVGTEYISDIVIGLQYGDEGKGKIVHALAKKADAYDYCVRFNGGANAGHTIYHDGKKIVTHQVPSGILFGIPCIIGDNCYVDLDKLHVELAMLQDNGINTHDMIYLSTNVHIITSEHLREDAAESAIGTTKSGIGPCARDKYGRTGMRVDMLMSFGSSDKIDSLIHAGIQIVNPAELFIKFYSTNGHHPRVLVEGAQAYGLDITHGDYPYVTSSHCLATDCLNMGINMMPTDKKGNKYKLRIWGVAKAYETYVGAKHFQPDDEPTLCKIQTVGHEFGSTTGRKRQCNYLDLSRLRKAGFLNQITHLVINKCDVLEHPDVNTFRFADVTYEAPDIECFKLFVTESMKSVPCLADKNIYFEHAADSDTVFQ